MRQVIAILLIALAAAARAQSAPDGTTKACPTSRAFLEPQLKTRPSDGEYYFVQRQAIRMPIARILEAMGGPKRASAIAMATRAHAERRIEAGATGAARRHWQDTILRADALVAILKCMFGDGEPV